MSWERRRILVWGKTRPELSTTYKEIVCTGGVFHDSRRLVRIYPIPLRFMDDEKLFAKYQWIEADVMRNPADARPESYKIRYDNIKVLDKIKTKRGGDWSARAEWVLASQNVFASVEALQDQQQKDGTSLGLMKPKLITDIKAQAIGASAQAEFMERWNECSRQGELDLDPNRREIQPLKAPEYRFKVLFSCEDARCTGHEFGVLDWEVDALYYRLRHINKEAEHVAVEKVTTHLRDVLGPTHDAYFFLGNISSHPRMFTVVGLWHPKTISGPKQTEMF